MDTSLIPQECSSEQLFRAAEEVLTLQTEIAGLEDQYSRLYTRYFGEVPGNVQGEFHIRMYVEGQIKENNADLWLEIDSKRARYKGLLAKAGICRTAFQALAIEQGVMIPS